jgi:hypothetical protein
MVEFFDFLECPDTFDLLVYHRGWPRRNQRCTSLFLEGEAMICNWTRDSLSFESIWPQVALTISMLAAVHSLCWSWQHEEWTNGKNASVTSQASVKESKEGNHTRLD